MTENKTRELNGKIAALAESDQAEVLTSNIVRFNTVKPTNGCIYYSIQILEEAIREKKIVTIHYFHLNERRERVYRREWYPHSRTDCAGLQQRQILPHLLQSTADSNYNYKLDRIEKVELLNESISIKAKIQSRSVAKYNAQVLKMYGGETV